MVRTATGIKEDNEVELCLDGMIPFRLWVSPTDTIREVKDYIGEDLELYPDEMNIVSTTGLVSEEALASSFSGGEPLVVKERTDTSDTSDTSDTFDVWWADEVPTRHLLHIPSDTDSSDEERTVLDLRWLHPGSLRRIRSWLYQARGITDIWILGTHPLCPEILYAVAEDILSLPCIERIHLQNPKDAGFLLPPRSARRSKEMDNAHSYVTREPLMYLYQHLLLDSYRPSAEEVEIWVDGGLLSNREHRIRFTGHSL